MSATKRENKILVELGKLMSEREDLEGISDNIERYEFLSQCIHLLNQELIFLREQKPKISRLIKLPKTT